ncbi:MULTISPECIES: patatin-like phospholipase family protein [unclassified Thauera]|uniref:patatin-like phospholipase family protein n=1 Tax=unclassified Thauera TaxID=2609274 RepID=UPI0002D13740|nr:MULTISPECIES: patatin-like phospholipase family protein [unclassified Thauera]ENO91625.1 putative esterase of the alpha-beta hydrolase superfamily protein [Thauera sp. 28]WBL63809.1 patatin-like phospholipase family protein [Thauera sp. WB-2]HAG75805.1 patatin-like phospholipase family protein [Thauera sp.]HNR61998.1 patatin-like phospholipase family protein [Thauera sp.]HNS93859.1 patatin-like phospholipase family protein [Thauera sp.]
MSRGDEARVGLALSGGGFRATLFGLGSLWRLNEAGLLGRLARVTSVSGGSILAGVLAHRWRALAFSEGRADNFETVIAQPVRAFCSQSIDVKTAALGHLVPFVTSGDFLARRYAKDLFGDTLLRELPDPALEAAPRFIFYATNMQTGRSFRFRQDYIADYYLGLSRSTDVRLAEAVAASSAFPPIFSPVVLKSDPATWVQPERELPNLEALRRRIVLADGGVYDNMGLEALLREIDLILVSDAGAPFEIDESPFEDDLLQLGRVRDILIDQTRALRKRWLVEDFQAGRRRGAYWGIGTRIGDYKDPRALVADNTLTTTLEHIPTRLKKFEPRDQGRLINWGYALADVALRMRAGLAIPAAQGWPVPEWPLG